MRLLLLFLQLFSQGFHVRFIHWQNRWYFRLHFTLGSRRLAACNLQLLLQCCDLCLERLVLGLEGLHLLLQVTDQLGI